MGTKLLDLFCGAGGAACGYERSGFAVTGVDSAPQPRYLRSGAVEFIQADAFDFVEKHGREYDVIHASPPCQAYSPLRFLHPSRSYPELIPRLRELLISIGIPWIIENVMTAPLRGNEWIDSSLPWSHGIVLCGSMFGLRTYRHRRFESSMYLEQPRHPRHIVRSSNRNRQADWEAGNNISVTGQGGRRISSLALDIDWMTGLELSQAIPPAYTRYIGLELRASGAFGEIGG